MKEKKVRTKKSGNVVQIKCQYPLFRQHDLSLSYREEIKIAGQDNAQKRELHRTKNPPNS